jgi:hypothetical protein
MRTPKKGVSRKGAVVSQWTQDSVHLSATAGRKPQRAIGPLFASVQYHPQPICHISPIGPTRLIPAFSEPLIPGVKNVKTNDNFVNLRTPCEDVSCILSAEGHDIGSPLELESNHPRLF